ncbi:hypothetical protein [Streptomyces sp. NPDC005322]|uniref:hypothetical protein n=1 Tax=unclassified Streptomyces TaxID=2593676 RepID=UPI0033B3314E
MREAAVLNAVAARAGLPGAAVFRPALFAAGGLLAVVFLRACARPESATGWRAALRPAAYETVRRPRGSAVLLLAVATAAVCARGPARPSPSSPRPTAAGRPSHGASPMTLRRRSPFTCRLTLR